MWCPPDYDPNVMMGSFGERTLSLLDTIKQRLSAPQSANNDAQVLAAISSLQLEVETPLDTIYRIGHQVITLWKCPLLELMRSSHGKMLA